MTTSVNNLFLFILDSQSTPPKLPCPIVTPSITSAPTPMFLPGPPSRLIVESEDSGLLAALRRNRAETVMLNPR